MRCWQFGPVLVALAAIAGIAPARADTTIYYHAGNWDAFEATGPSGQTLCGIGSHNVNDGSTLSLRSQPGTGDVLFIASKAGWQIPAGTKLPVVMQIGLSQPWTEQAAGNGDSVQWTVDGNDMQAFDAQFSGASSMTVTFPSGSEPAWVMGLAGSSAVSTAMARCVADVQQRAAAPGPAPQGTTQPFAATANPGSNPNRNSNPAPNPYPNPNPAPPTH
ncbi:MAG TPA: hypothetical protein VGG99_28385 [Acetobacteraceae bacterium]|jgi:hypothetical protein